MHHDALQTHVLPCAEAVMAGTLALMTGHAQCSCKRQQAAMASKISANLACMTSLAGVSPSFTTVVQRLLTHWRQIAGEAGSDSDVCAQHPAAALLQ